MSARVWGRRRYKLPASRVTLVYHCDGTVDLDYQPFSRAEARRRRRVFGTSQHQRVEVQR